MSETLTALQHFYDFVFLHKKIIFLMLQKLVTANVPPHKYLGRGREFKCANYAKVFGSFDHFPANSWEGLFCDPWVSGYIYFYHHQFNII